MSLSSVESDAAAVETLLRTLSSEPPVRRLSVIAEENAKLKDENKSLVEENTATSRTIQRLQGKADLTECQLKDKKKELKEVADEKEKLVRDLAAMEAKFRASEKRAIELDDHFKRQQKTIRDELKESADELQRLAEFSIVLEPVDDNEERIRAELNSVFTSARNLAEAYLGEDLPDNILSSASLWEKICKHSSSCRDVPLLLSNSPLAKQMRIALLVSVLGHQLCNHIFQPTYLHSFEGLSGLSNVLKTLTERQPDLESHLRSVLLKASASITIENEPVDRACIKAVVSAVKDVAQMVVPEPKRTRFEADLHNFCNTACQKWRFIQTLDDQIVPSLGEDRTSKRKYNWALFSCNIPTPSPTAGPKQRANGTASAPGPQKRSASPASQSQGSLTSDLADGIAVWPAFYNLSTADEETLAEGFILPVSLTRAAEEEQNAVPTPTSPSSRSNFHKEQREMERSLNPKKRRQSIAAVNGQAGEAKERGSFLSKSSAGGAKGV